MKLLNSKVFEGVEYDINSIGEGGFVSGEDFGLPKGFYGGRVDKVAYTKIPGLYMCMEGMEVIDLLIMEDIEVEKEILPFEEEVGGELLDPDKFTTKELIEIAKNYDKEVPSKATKAEIVAIIGEVE